MRITVRVTPRCRKNRLVWGQGTLKVHVTVPPVEGAANEALIAFLAQRLNVLERDIRIIQGLSGRQKIVEIAGITASDMERWKWELPTSDDKHSGNTHND